MTDFDKRCTAYLGLAEKATKGRWKDKPSVHGNAYRYIQIGADDTYTTLELEPDDAAFIAASRTEAPALLREAREEIARLREALIDATAHLDGAASAYRKFAKRHPSLGRAETDPFFSTRVVDFEKAVERVRAALKPGGGE